MASEEVSAGLKLIDDLLWFWISADLRIEMDDWIEQFLDLPVAQRT